MVLNGFDRAGEARYLRMVYMSTYCYLFPFEKVPAGSKILLYGAGNTGTEYVKQILLTDYCQIVGVIDKNAKNIPPMVVPVYAIDAVKKLDFDYIVIAMKNPIYNDRIFHDLMNCGVSQSQIVFVGMRRREVPVFLNKKTTDYRQFAFHQKGISIALQIPSGIGDIIITKRLVMQLIKLSPKVIIDLFCSNEAAKCFYVFQKNVNQIVLPSLASFHDVYHKYMIAISMRFYLNFYRFDERSISLIDSDFAQVMKRLYQATNQYLDDCTVNGMLHIFYERADYADKSIYQYPDYYADVLGIKDDRVSIPLRDEWKERFMALPIRHYLTVNYGNGSGSATSSKQWPLSYFEQLVEKLKVHYPKLEIVQLGASDAKEIEGCDWYLFGKSLELVKYILMNSLLHIDIEGGLVHIATQLGTKCVVLFGPTSIKAFGYSQNINIQAGDCHNCCGIEGNIYACARHLKIPACMEAITVEMVFTKIAEYLDYHVVQRKD